jgi:2-amino-4-hydroxy-6-hydroxymethyldihydropteridine diphosphokinase
MLHRVLIGMGSNIEPESNMERAAAAIRMRFPDVRFSKVYRSAAVGMDGDDFLNACCLFETEMDLDALRDWLKALEDAHGRDRSQGSWRPRTLDLDLLIYGDEILDQDLYRYAHVYGPAAELVAMELPDEGRAQLQRQALVL